MNPLSQLNDPQPPEDRDFISRVRIWPGYLIWSIYVLVVIGQSWLVFGDPSHTSWWPNVISAVGWTYWLYVVYRIHRVVAEATNSSYPITPERAVVLHFLPIFNLYWLFNWSAEIMSFINRRQVESAIPKYLPGMAMISGILINVFTGWNIGYVIFLGTVFFMSAKIRNILENHVPAMDHEFIFLWIFGGSSMYGVMTFLADYILLGLDVATAFLDVPRVVIWAITGLLVGFIQLLILQHYTDTFRWEWVAACVLGFVAGATALRASTAGLAIGFAQYYVLRKYFDGAGWWIFLSTIGWVAGYSIGSQLTFIWASSIGLTVTGVGLPNFVIGGMFSILGYSAFSGIYMIRLYDKPVLNTGASPKPV